MTSLLMLFAFTCVQPAFAGGPPKRAQKYEEVAKWAYTRCGVSPKYRSWLGSQIEAESAYNPQARSIYARGLAQNTPENEEDLLRRYPELRKYANKLDPRWQLLGQCLMMKRLMENLTGSEYKDDFRISARSYNGGVGWIIKERRLARKNSQDPNDYDVLVPLCSEFRGTHCKENLAYSPRIAKYRRMWFMRWTM